MRTELICLTLTFGKRQIDWEAERRACSGRVVAGRSNHTAKPRLYQTFRRAERKRLHNTPHSFAAFRNKSVEGSVFQRIQAQLTGFPAIFRLGQRASKRTLRHFGPTPRRQTCIHKDYKSLTPGSIEVWILHLLNPDQMDDLLQAHI